jgi:hypothetical protein
MSRLQGDAAPCRAGTGDGDGTGTGTGTGDGDGDGDGVTLWRDAMAWGGAERGGQKLLNTPPPAGIPSRGLLSTLLVHSAPGLGVSGAVGALCTFWGAHSPKSPTREGDLGD